MLNKVLIIEGDSFLSLQLTDILVEGGFIVSRASSYREALDKLYDFDPHIIVTNEFLPDKDGVAASRHIVKSLEIPTILVGNDYTDDAWRKLSESYAANYIRLPIVPAVFIARVKAILRRYEVYRYAY